MVPLINVLAGKIVKNGVRESDRVGKTVGKRGKMKGGRREFRMRERREGRGDICVVWGEIRKNREPERGGKEGKKDCPVPVGWRRVFISGTNLRTTRFQRTLGQ